MGPMAGLLFWWLLLKGHRFLAQGSQKNPETSWCFAHGDVVCVAHGRHDASVAQISKGARGVKRQDEVHALRLFGDDSHDDH